MLYGLMTEEINHSYDGGLYAELIQNRTFKDDKNTPIHWSLIQEGGATGSVALDDGQPINTALTTCVKLTVTSATAGQRVGLANDGYWGIPVHPDTRYRASFYARAADGFTGPLTVTIESSNGSLAFARASVPALTTTWKPYTVFLNTGKVTPSRSNRFVISAARPGTIWLNQVSLFPPTYQNRANGNRIDLMRLLGDMKPAFLRFPGGNYLEGNRIEDRFDWKRTIGDIADRPGHQGPWGYRSSDGMGLLEFLEWCEDLHMEPLLAVFAGYALNGEHVVAGPQLDPFVQDALDELEYVTGSPSTRWGAQRAKDGHPSPFKLRYVEIGNEDWFDRSGSYEGRFASFYDAIKARYPALQLIATRPVTSRNPDVLDDHYYRSAHDMEADVHHYDAYDRRGAKIFVGEWASTEGSPTPTMQAALGDAAWLTGLERNSDLVVLSCYAPLLVNVNEGARQWGTNLIGYDALQSFGSPSYYVQKMFGSNRGDIVLPVDIVPPPNHTPPAALPLPTGGVGVGTWATEAEFKDVRVTQGDHILYKNDLTASAQDWKLGAGDWRVQDGALRQSADGVDCRATVGDAGWGDYTYQVKARKLGGAEGFLILFHARDRGNYLWWNIGGWGNTRTAIERASDGAKRELGKPTSVTVETGRWYDIRVELQGRTARCYLDNRLITTVTDEPTPPPAPLYATASRDEARGEVILKVVNVSAAAQRLQIDLQGAGSVDSQATSEVLKGFPNDVNTIDNPLKVAPESVPIEGASASFTHEFPAHSVSVIRLKVK
jgi:alpha-L-arabinofuranosidase